MKHEQACPECGCILTSDIFSADKMRQRFFAIVRDVHHNLPEAMLERFPSSEHLRKHALIAAGWCDVALVMAGSDAAAPAIADVFKSRIPYCLADVHRGVITLYTARSMARSALLKPQFLEVSEKALDWIDQQTGIDGRASEAA